MISRRLGLLLVILVVMLVLRWRVPPSTQPEPSVSLAVPVMRSPTPIVGNPLAGVPSSAPLPAEGAIDMPGDAFAVRVAKVAVPFPPPPPAVAPQAPIDIPPPPPPPPPPPAIEVIGRWDDGISPGVFISTGQGTVLARPGTILLGEYRVTAVSPHQLTVKRTTSNHEWVLPVPTVNATR